MASIKIQGMPIFLGPVFLLCGSLPGPLHLDVCLPELQLGSEDGETAAPAAAAGREKWRPAVSSGGRPHPSLVRPSQLTHV